MRIAVTANLKKDTTASASPAETADSDLLAGETEEEFDSLETVEVIRRALEGAGHETFYLAADRTLPFVLSKDVILRAKPEESQILRSAQDDKLLVDFVFNIAEGFSGRSREAHVPALLEIMGIPYTGSDPLALALTLDKGLAKFTALGAGVATADFVVLRNSVIPAKAGIQNDKLPAYPLFAKPCWEGSSKGIRASSRVENQLELEEEVTRLRLGFPGQPVLVERYLGGREFTVGVLGNDMPRIVGVMEVKPRDGKRDFLYSIKTKRNWRKEVSYECPPKGLKDTDKKYMEAMALRLFEVFGCRDLARFDFRMNERGKIFFLEANPLPGLNPESGDFVIMARLMGWTYEKVICGILEAAVRRKLPWRQGDPRSV